MVTIDADSFPHIIDAIFEYAPVGSLTSLRAASWSFKRRADERLLDHVAINLYRDPHICAVAIIENPDVASGARIVRGPRFGVPLLSTPSSCPERSILPNIGPYESHYPFAEQLVQSESGLLDHINAVDLVFVEEVTARHLLPFLRDVITLRTFYTPWREAHRAFDSLLYFPVWISNRSCLLKRAKRLVLSFTTSRSNQVTVARISPGAYLNLEEIVLVGFRQEDPMEYEFLDPNGYSFHPVTEGDRFWLYVSSGSREINTRILVNAFTTMSMDSYRQQIPRTQWLREVASNQALQPDGPDRSFYYCAFPESSPSSSTTLLAPPVLSDIASTVEPETATPVQPTVPPAPYPTSTSTALPISHARPSGRRCTIL